MGQSKKQSQISFTICYILLYHGIGTEKMHFQPIKTAFFRLMRQKRDGVWSKSAARKQKAFVCCPGRDSSGRALSEYAGYATINNRTGKSPPFISRVDGQASSAAGTGSCRADEKPVENRLRSSCRLLLYNFQRSVQALRQRVPFLTVQQIYES